MTQFKIFIQEVFIHMLKQSPLVEFTANLMIFFFKLIFCSIFYFISLKLAKKLKPIIIKKERKRVLDLAVRGFIKSILKFCLHGILIIICLIIIGVKETSLLTFIGSLGIGVGLALKDNLSNFAGGVIILIFKVYKVGDEVNIAGEIGYIHEIDIFATTLKSHNDDLIVIPNGSITSGKVINYTKTPNRRLKFLIGVSYNSDINKARKSLENLLFSHPFVLKHSNVFSHVETYSDSSIIIALKGWTLNEHYWTVYKEILNDIKNILDKENIEIPFPQMDIHVIKT